MATSVAARHQQRQRLVAQHPFQAAAIDLDGAIDATVEAACRMPLARRLADCWRSRRLHIIGVSVSETIGRDDDRDGQRQRELAEHAADQAGHEQQRDEHRDQRHRQRDHGEADLARAAQRGLERRSRPFSMWRTMFSIITIASSTTKPVPMVSAISDRLSSEKPQNHMTPKVAISDSGRATPAMMVARMVRRKMQHHQHDQHDAQHQRELHVADRGADACRCGRARRSSVDADRHRALQARQLVLDALARSR